MATDPTAKDAFATLSSWTNGMMHRDDEFVDQFLSEHRTLQSQMASLFLTCLVAMAEHPERVDARNEAAMRKAIIVKNALEEAGEPTSVPFI